MTAPINLDGTTSRALIHAQAEAADELADALWNQTQDYEPATVAARKHLASLSPERRAQLEREWQ